MLNVASMLEFMAMSKDAQQPLYMQGVQLVLRKMAEDTGRFDWAEFKRELTQTKFNSSQKTPLEQRMALLESFVDENAGKNLFNAEDGRLTIVDLSDPFVDESLACVLFNISNAHLPGKQ